MQALLETGQKKLVECTYDSLWGNGIPLHQPSCLNQHLWKNQGILGEILQEIRQIHLDQARALLPSFNPWIHQGPPNITNTTQQQANTAPTAFVVNTSNHSISRVTPTASSPRATVTTPATAHSEVIQAKDSTPTDTETTNSKL